MPQNAPDSQYEFVCVGGDFNSHYFTTVDDVTYEIRFTPSDYLFEAYGNLTIHIFEMVISVADNPTGGRLPADPLVAPTIFAIFDTFFRSQDQAIIFICDSSDGRQLARHRKFTTWFYNTSRETYLAKFDRKAIDGNRIIYLSMILDRHHPQLGLIAEIFMRLGEEEK